mgnify:CR=1 FL=1
MAAFALVYRVFSLTENIIARIAVVAIAVGQPLSYLNVALSNPGVIISQPICENMELTKYCKDCHFNV